MHSTIAVASASRVRWTEEVILRGASGVYKSS
jgi:hypothetical protein